MMNKPKMTKLINSVMNQLARQLEVEMQKYMEGGISREVLMEKINERLRPQVEMVCNAIDANAE